MDLVRLVNSALRHHIDRFTKDHSVPRVGHLGSVKIDHLYRRYVPFNAIASIKHLRWQDGVQFHCFSSVSGGI